MSVVELINLAKEEKWKICLYGLGTYAKACSYIFLKYLEIIPDFICDKDEESLQKFNIKIGKKIKIQELKRIKENILVLLFLSSKYEKNVYEEFKDNKNIKIINWKEIHSLLNQDKILCDYFGINKFNHNNAYNKRPKNVNCIKDRKTNNIAVFTCITGSYDRLNKPEVIEEGCDYYLITDELEYKHIENVQFYKIISVYDVVPSNITLPKEQNRYCKLHAAEIFYEYDYVIYLDGNIKMLKGISDLITLIGDFGLALHKHPFCNDAYLETFSLSVRKRIDKNDAVQIVKKFAKEGFTRNYGMAECGVIIYDNKNSIAKEILKQWYENYERNLVKRDQIYFAYTLWKMNIEMSDVCTLPGNIRTNGYFCISENHIKR